MLMLHARASYIQGRRLMDTVWSTDSIPDFHTVDRSLWVTLAYPQTLRWVHGFVPVRPLSPNLTHLAGTYAHRTAKETALDRINSRALTSLRLQCRLWPMSLVCQTSCGGDQRRRVWLQRILMYGDGRTDLNLRVLSFLYTRCLCSKGRSEVRCVAQQLHSVVRSLSHFAMQLLGPSPVLTRSRMEKG